LPTYSEAAAAGSPWRQLSPAQSIYHDNGRGKKELKFVNPDGREVVFDGDTHERITDPNIVGTYNYVTVLPGTEYSGILGNIEYGLDIVGHGIVDVVPYWLAGNCNGDTSSFIDRISGNPTGMSR
jgi:hypothetical protein